MFGLSCLVGPGVARQARVGPDSYYLQSHKMRARPVPVVPVPVPIGGQHEPVPQPVPVASE